MGELHLSDLRAAPLAALLLELSHPFSKENIAYILSVVKSKN
ncbi:MAG: hypothetical protein G01um101470_477 [Parcubacteria group bacterium Gr01-1014_70]|nr:MAG: hypothetical protein G01um101470_477 [Parcubacteria group bacterium Gr01-1014_70]